MSSAELKKCLAADFCQSQGSTSFVAASTDVGGIEVFCDSCQRHYGPALLRSYADERATFNPSAFFSIFLNSEEYLKHRMSVDACREEASDEQVSMTEREVQLIRTYRPGFALEDIEPDEEEILDSEPVPHPRPATSVSSAVGFAQPSTISNKTSLFDDQATAAKVIPEPQADDVIEDLSMVSRLRLVSPNPEKDVKSGPRITGAREPLTAERLCKRPSEKYKKLACQRASLIFESPVEDYERACEILVAQARTNDIMHVDLVDACDQFEELLSRHRNADVAALASTFIFQENIIIVDSQGGAVEMVYRAAAEEAMECQLIKAPERGSSREAVSVQIKAMAAQFSSFSKQSSGRVVVISGASRADDSFKHELFQAVTTRRIGAFPVPSDVRIVFTETGEFDPEQYPAEVVAQSICFAVEGRSSNPIDEIIEAAQTRQKLLMKQLDQALASGDEKRQVKLRQMLEKSGYLGAYEKKKGSYEAPAKEVFNDRARRLVESLLQKSGTIFYHDKALMVFDVTSPEKSKFRKEIAERLLRGICPTNASETMMQGYESQHTGYRISGPTIEDVLVGYGSLDKVRELLGDESDLDYSTYIAVELRTSQLVDAVFQRGGEKADKIRQIFFALMDTFPDTAAGVLEDRPYFIS